MIPVKNVSLLLVILGMVFAVPTNLDIVINNDADYTDTTTVNLTTLSADDAVRCNLSNDETSWTEYNYGDLPTAWDLESGADGLRTVYFKCTDDPVNETNWTIAETDTVTLDTTAPSVSSQIPTGTVTDTTPTISASLSDSGSGVDDSTIVLRLDGSEVATEVPYTPSSALSFGSHDVELTVADNAGNLQNVSWSFSIASSGLGFDDYGPENNSYTADKTPTISVILVDSGSGINESTLILEVDGTDRSSSASYQSSSKNYSYTSTTLADGNHSAEVWVEDNTGMESYTKWYFYVDTADPTISLLVPSDDSVVASANQISAKIDDIGSGVDEDGIFMELNDIDVSSSVSYYTSTETAVFTPSVDLTPGTYTVEVWARDEVGNEANAEWSFTIASDEPTISSRVPSADSTISNPRPEISATVTDAGGSGIDWDKTRVFVDSAEVTGDSEYNAGSGKVYYTPDEDLEDGEHSVEIRVWDNINQQATSEWSFTVDSSAPLPLSDFTVIQNESGTYLSWEPSESEDVVNYVVYGAVSSFTSVSGKAPLATLDADATEYFHDITTRYYYAVVPADENGNEGEPAFAGTCDVYTVASGWTDYECCSDVQCLTGYYCDLSTHLCRISTGDEKDDAEDAIDDAENIIQNAEDAGKNITEAQDYFEDAENAYNAGNYEQAKHFADLAKEAALSAPELEEEPEDAGKKELPCCPSTFIILIVLGFAAFGRK